MEIITTIAALRYVRHSLIGSVGLVPTMGYLHRGHIALVEQAARANDHVIVSIFVNPTQFGPTEDFASYPRDPDRDLAMLQESRVSLVFMPTPAAMYPAGFQTSVELGEIAQGLEGSHRPGHFRGVSTVVSKLFNLIQPDRAYFGQKDAQQVAVIQRLAIDLNFPIEIVVVPIQREADGLALSSRNVHLSESERAAAPVIYHALQAARAQFDGGERLPAAILKTTRTILASEPLLNIEYISIADIEMLSEYHDDQSNGPQITRPALLSLAVHLGKTRLIDNIVLG